MQRKGTLAADMAFFLCRTLLIDGAPHTHHEYASARWICGRTAIEHTRTRHDSSLNKNFHIHTTRTHTRDTQTASRNLRVRIEHTRAPRFSNELDGSEALSAEYMQNGQQQQQIPPLPPTQHPFYTRAYIVLYTQGCQYPNFSVAPIAKLL